MHSWPPLSHLVVFGFIALSCAVVLNRLRNSLSLRRKGVNLPPGPPRHFLMGNVPDMPTSDYHLGFARLAQQYGPVMQMTLPTQNIVILSTAKAAEDLLMRRGSLYADRPAFPMMELMGWGWGVGTRRHGEAWRSRRKLLHQHLNARVMNKHSDLQCRTALIFARKLLDNPKEFDNHVKWATAANILHAAYGFDIDLKDDPLVKLEEEAVESFTRAFVPGKYAVDIIPSLKYVPDWFPGVEFKKVAAEGRRIVTDVVNVPFERAKQELALGRSSSSVVTDSLTLEGSKEQEAVIKEAVASMYFAGADTTVSSLMSFFLEMVRYPDVQRKAYSELQRVVGTDRLPTFADRESLPYIEAVIREVYRMYPVAPLGIAHAAREDDVYENMLIKKGSTVISNIWAILHDEELYPNPHIFDPERFLRDGNIDDSVMDPKSAFFGYGHRICPGAHFADTSVYIAVVTTLACFKLDTAVVNGIRKNPSGDFHHGFFSIPLPFECSIVARSEKVEQLIAQNLDAQF